MQCCAIVRVYVCAWQLSQRAYLINPNQRHDCGLLISHRISRPNERTPPSQGVRLLINNSAQHGVAKENCLAGFW